MIERSANYDEVLKLGDGDIQLGMRRFILQYQISTLRKEREWLDRQIEALNRRWNEVNGEINEIAKSYTKKAT